MFNLWKNKTCSSHHQPDQISATFPTHLSIHPGGGDPAPWRLCRIGSGMRSQSLPCMAPGGSDVKKHRKSSGRHGDMFPDDPWCWYMNPYKTGSFIRSMLVNIPYMDHRGLIHCEFWLVLGIIPTPLKNMFLRQLR